MTNQEIIEQFAQIVYASWVEIQSDRKGLFSPDWHHVDDSTRDRFRKKAAQALDLPVPIPGNGYEYK